MASNITTLIANATAGAGATTTTPIGSATTTTSTGVGGEVYFSLGKIDFGEDTDFSLWLAFFVVPAAYLTVLLLAIVVDMETCTKVRTSVQYYIFSRC